MSITTEIFKALYYIFPAYCANGAPVIFGGSYPLDFGKKLIDGRPIFGPNKTVRGLVAGILVGTLVGWAQENLAPNIGLEKGSVILGFALSLGAVIGDLIGSFAKRRLNIQPGAPLPISDQVDFVLVALLFSVAAGPPTVSAAIMIIVLTLPIHLSANIIAYLLHLKKSPW